MKSPIAYVFGEFRLSVQDRLLERNGERVVLTPKVIDTLFVLVENAKQVVTKAELMQAVWPDVTVVESGLTRNLSVLRKALEEGVPEGTYIETIPRRGYRFVAEVREEYESVPEPIGHVMESAPAVEAPPLPKQLTVSNLRWRVIAAAIAVVVLAFAIVRWPRPDAKPVIDPGVQIGEHLLYKLAPEQTIRAVDHFEQALSTSPDSAAAHAGLAISLLQMSALGLVSLPEVADRAEAAAKRAVELDPRLPSAHDAAGLVSLFYRWNFEQAERSFRRALELDPTSVQSRVGYTQLKFAKAEVNEAIRLSEEALRLDPASPMLGTWLCQAFYYARDFRRAEAECRKVLDREPHFALAEYYLALSLGWVGRTDEAREIFNGGRMAPGVVEADLAWLSLRQGDRRPAMQVLQQRRELIRQGKVNASVKILLCSILGANDEAFEAVESAIATHAVEILTLRIDPRLEGIRSDPRFAGVLRRIATAP